MKLWELQQALCRSDPNTTVCVRAPDGPLREIDRIEQCYVGGPIALFVTGKPKVHYEYETTVRHCGQEGTSQAQVPHPPEPAEEWELVSATIGGNSFYYFWKRLVANDPSIQEKVG